MQNDGEFSLEVTNGVNKGFVMKASLFNDVVFNSHGCFSGQRYWFSIQVPL